MSSLTVAVLDEDYLLHAQQMFAVPRRSLGDVVASLEDAGQQIIQAIDDVITTAYG